MATSIAVSIFLAFSAAIIGVFVRLSLRLSRMDVPDAERTHPPFRTVAAFNRWWEQASQMDRDRFMRRAGN